MLLIDGCSIVELFHENNMEELRDKDNTLMKAEWIRYCLQHNLLLLKNQLSLFILNKLCDLTKGSDEHLKLIDIATMYFGLEDSSQYPTLHESKHLLACLMCPGYDGAMPMKEKLMFMSSAMELRESGVKLKAVRGRHMKDIKFKNRKLEIPVLSAQDHAKSQFQNLITNEQHRQGEDINYFTNYVTFMDCLINSSKNVEVLCHARIIKNYLGDDEVAVQMFNKRNDYVTLSNCYCYEILKNVNVYCNERWNNQTAKLMREYILAARVCSQPLCCSIL